MEMSIKGLPRLRFLSGWHAARAPRVSGLTLETMNIGLLFVSESNSFFVKALCLTSVGISMISGALWSWWRGMDFYDSRCMAIFESNENLSISYSWLSTLPSPSSEVNGRNIGDDESTTFPVNGDRGTRSLVAFNYTIGSSQTNGYQFLFDLASALSFAGLSVMYTFGSGTY